jgi:hypothetical protein
MQKEEWFMKLNWNRSLSSSVSGHLDALLRSEQAACDEERMFARATNALPVYSDLSGTLGITEAGDILYYASESERVTPVTDDRWRTLAAVSAAHKYHDLKEMLPARPAAAKSCPVCSGAGRQMNGKAFCGKCSGLGWIT